MDNVFGKFIEDLRGDTSLRKASERSGLSHTYIRDLELGINRKTKAPIVPTPDTIKRISTAYNYPYEELLKVAGILEEERTYTVSKNMNELIIRDLVEKYNVDLSVGGNKEKLEKIIQIVVNDFERKSQQ